MSLHFACFVRLFQSYVQLKKSEKFECITYRHEWVQCRHFTFKAYYYCVEASEALLSLTCLLVCFAVLLSHPNIELWCQKWNSLVWFQCLVNLRIQSVEVLCSCLSFSLLQHNSSYLQCFVKIKYSIASSSETESLWVEMLQEAHCLSLFLTFELCFLCKWTPTTEIIRFSFWWKVEGWKISVGLDCNNELIEEGWTWFLSCLFHFSSTLDSLLATPDERRYDCLWGDL